MTESFDEQLAVVRSLQLSPRERRAVAAVLARLTDLEDEVNRRLPLLEEALQFSQSANEGFVECEARLAEYEQALTDIAHLLKRFPKQAVLVRDGEFVKGAQPMCAIRKAAAAYRRTQVAIASQADAQGEG